MNITLIGSYPPRKCGIATFTENLCEAIEANNAGILQHNVRVIAVNDNEEGYAYDKRVVHTINQEQQADYIAAANFINNSNTDIVILQHEYGIFGGESGIFILTLLHHLKVPVIATVHTVLKKPTYLQKLIMQEIAKTTYKLVVMSRLAVDFLQNNYEIHAAKISVIEHGVPMVDGNVSSIKNELASLGNKKLLFTFGLLSKNKGIETVIKALPAVIEQHPDLLYIVLGNTHPSVVRHAGEEYRNYLLSLAEKLNVEKNIAFINKFVSDDDLLTYLKNIDIYITPYLNEEQITSGTLTYAVGSGAACVSTPYWHAKELLEDGRGRLFPFKNYELLGDLLNDLLGDPVKLKSIRKKAFAYGQYIQWPKIGERYIDQSDEAINDKAVKRYNGSRFNDIRIIPAFSLAHVKRLTDDTGIVQHAKYGIPNLKEGYCLDDNARALIMALMAYHKYHSKEALELLPVYLSYIHYMQREDGWFRNFLHFNRSYLDEIGSEDSFGRTIWALCYLMFDAPDNSYVELAHELFSKSYPVFKELKYIRGIANTIIGISYYLRCHPGDENMVVMITELSDKLMAALEEHSGENWTWFEDILTYDNGILPLALLHSYEITSVSKFKKAALSTIAFLKQRTLHKGYLVPIGNEGWCRKEEGSNTAVFDQQAIEVMAMVLMFEQAYKVTNDPQYKEDMNNSFMWFLGKNELHIPLYDHETHGCSDGLEYNSINRNQGAESTLAYFISYLAIMKANKRYQQLQEYLVEPHTREIKKARGIASL